jgi:hypothetical protein
MCPVRTGHTAAHGAHRRARGRPGPGHAPVRGRGPPRRRRAAAPARLRRPVPGRGRARQAAPAAPPAAGTPCEGRPVPAPRRGPGPPAANPGRHADGPRRRVGAGTGARRSHLNDALAVAAARWTVDQAIAARATVIHVGDLRSMEAQGMGRSLDTRLSQQVRGAITDRLRHLAAEAGIAVVTVPAANTSRHCPRCLLPLRHRAAPNRPTRTGWTWAMCPNPACGWRGDRDHGGVAAHRRPRPHPPGRGVHRWPPDLRAGPVQDRPGPAPDLTLRAQVTRGTLPGEAPWPDRPGGRRESPPRAAGCPARPPGTGRARHERYPGPPPGPRSSARRGVPPARPRHLAPMAPLLSRCGPLRVPRPITDAPARTISAFLLISVPQLSARAYHV